jgi:hypothetical protein
MTFLLFHWEMFGLTLQAFKAEVTQKYMQSKLRLRSSNAAS